MSDYQILLHRLAHHAGIALNWQDIWGVRHEVPVESLAALLAAMDLPAESEAVAEATLQACRRRHATLPTALVLDASATAVVPLPRGFGAREWVLELESGEQHRGQVAADTSTLILPTALPEGYHRLDFIDGTACPLRIIATPAMCHVPPRRGPGEWGLALQLYALRSDRQWGMGDFTDLGQVVAGVALRGGTLVGINPLHALFPAEPGRISPYSPSSRLFLNPLYLDVTAAPDFKECPELQELIPCDALRSAPLIDYPAVARLKASAFALLWQSFKARHLAAPTPRGRAFRRFQAAGGAALARFARFHALQAHLLAEHGPAWRNWPPSYRDAEQPEVADFAAEHHDQIEQHEYLQWEAERQLAAAATGLPIGLYRDLAIGTDPYGADSWSTPRHYLTGASIGAPPDLLAGTGQNWGLTTWSPAALATDGYAGFIATLRANMRHAGGLRIDHVMGLKQLYLIPEGMPASAGAYVRYPFRDLVRILALESRRHNCLVVGEDLGTVPRGFRPVMRRAGILSCRVLPFERRRDGSFKPPSAYPALAAASAGTHDLPPLKAWWLGADIRLREAAGQYPDEAARDHDEASRSRDRRALLTALQEQRLLSAAMATTLLPPDGPPVFDPALTAAVHRFLDLTPSRLVLFQAEDLFGLDTMVNLPGTIDEHPNWRRRLPVPISDLLARHD